MNATRLDNLNEAFIKNFISVFLCVIINFINGSFVYIYFRSQAFQRDPRYVLYIHLVFNDMVMLSLSVMLQILTYTLRLRLTSCCVLLLIILTSNKNSPVNLACMAVERYIAVCWPLHHPQLCTVGRAYFLIALIWGMSFLPGLTDLLILLLASPGSGPMHSSMVMCYPGNVFNMPQNKTSELASEVLFLSMVSITLVVTYLKVLFAASAVSAASRESARKARNTILLHGVQLLICMLSYISPIISWPLIKAMPHQRTSILFTTFIITNILPRLLSPLIYGVRDQKFHTQLRLLFICRSCRPREAERLKPTAGERVRPIEGNRGRPTVGVRGRPTAGQRGRPATGEQERSKKTKRQKRQP